VAKPRSSRILFGVLIGEARQPERRQMEAIRGVVRPGFDDLNL